MPPRKRQPAKDKCGLICCTTQPGALERIRESVADWAPGKWAEQNAYGPACRCGLKQNPMTVGFGQDDGSCPRHGPSERSG